MNPDLLDKIPDDLLRKLVRDCSQCHHRWMPKIKLNGTVTLIKYCPNCCSQKWNE